jgi:hypothetical protein
MKNQVVYNGMLDCIKKTYRNEGVTGFYKGLTPLLVRQVPASGVFFVTYEATLKALEVKHKE